MSTPEALAIVEIPVEAHQLTVQTVERNSPEYLLLHNGVIVQNEQGRRVVHIPCERDGAEAITRIITRACPQYRSDLLCLSQV